MKKIILITSCLLLSTIVPLTAKSDNNAKDINKVNTTEEKKDVSGKVVDEYGNPIIGATIVIKSNPTVGALSDIDGFFFLKNLEIGTILKVSYIGYLEKDVKVTDVKELTVILAENTIMTEEVVITAFGTGQKKESVVGSVAMIKPESLIVPATNLTNSFAGKMSGIIAFQRSGQPGSNSSDFYIRGVSTMSGVTKPLIILDGVEISTGDLDSLDPDIIEGFSILKDATATAMYGTRGANGVMIVKTKSGIASEKPIIGFRFETYLNTPTEKVKFADGSTYMSLYNEAITNQGTGDILYSNDQIFNTRNNTNSYIYPNINWYDEIFKNTALSEKINFNVRGGTEKIVYFMNVNFTNEGSMLKNKAKDYFSYDNNINIKRYAFQNNIDFHLSKMSTISLHLNVQLQDQKGPVEKLSDIYTSIMNVNPVDFPVSYPNADGDLWTRWGAYSGGNDQAAANPMALFTRGYQDYFASTVIANIDFDQKLDFLTEGLRFKGLFSFKNWTSTTTNRKQNYNRYSLDSYSQKEDGSYIYNVVPIGTPAKPTLNTENSTSGDRRIYAQAYLDYNKGFGSHNVSGMILANIDQYNENNPSGLIESLARRKIGFAGRFSYDYEYKYLFELNAGYNGSENFAPGHRWGFFPAAAIGWNVSEENFWEPIKNTISNLKLRASYGKVGNDQYSSGSQYERFIYMSDVTLQNDPSFSTGYGSNTLTLKGPTYNRFQNDNITWEVGKKLNIGFDMQLLNSLNISADFFREIRSDIFQQRQSIPNYLGTANTKVYGNFAKVKNYGFEFSADYGKQINKDLTIMFKGTFTYARNKVLEYDEAAGLLPYQSQIGKSLNVYKGYIAEGLYLDAADIANSPTSTLGNIAIAPGDIKYKDINGDGKITSEDMVYLGKPTIPEIIYGFGPSFVYKKWDFSFFFQGVANTSLMMSDFHPFGTQLNRNVLSFIADNHWSNDNQNPNAAYPRLTKYNNDNNTKNSDYWLRNGAFIRLKNIDLGYRFDKFRVYASGMNLLTFSSFKHWDPEQGGGKGLSYPPQKTFSLGIQMTFK